ncbi:MAG: DUF2283 domain-containing protein [Proteobacteria bacterium]|nr:DUF2283 domain-containing protein [Pseudomonadota bacterium]
MRIHYSHDADALYIRLKEVPIESTDEITEDIIMDYDKSGNVIGIEILSASERTDMQQLIIQAFEKVMIENPLEV